MLYAILNTLKKELGVNPKRARRREMSIDIFLLCAATKDTPLGNREGEIYFIESKYFLSKTLIKLRVPMLENKILGE